MDSVRTKRGLGAAHANLTYGRRQRTPIQLFHYRHQHRNAHADWRYSIIHDLDEVIFSRTRNWKQCRRRHRADCLCSNTFFFWWIFSISMLPQLDFQLRAHSCGVLFSFGIYYAPRMNVWPNCNRSAYEHMPNANWTRSSITDTHFEGILCFPLLLSTAKTEFSKHFYVQKIKAISTHFCFSFGMPRVMQINNFWKYKKEDLPKRRDFSGSVWSKLGWIYNEHDHIYHMVACVERSGVWAPRTDRWNPNQFNFLIKNRNRTNQRWNRYENCSVMSV